MSFTLFQDQIDFITDIKYKLKEKRKIIACAATGFGKSKVFINIAEGAIKKGKTVLILTESKKIFNQIKEEISDAELIDPDNHHIFIHPNRVYIAMAQTLCKRIELINQLNAFGHDLLVECDESHVGHFTKITEQLLKSYLIGFTATPDARWAKHLPLIYKDIVVGPQPHELVLNGRLCGYKHFARVGADLNKLVLQNGEFTEQSQEEVFQNAKVFEGMIEDLRNTPYKKCLVFTASVKDCNVVAEELRRNGIKCVSIHKNNKTYKCSDKEFDYRLSRFNPKLSKYPVTEDEEVSVCVSVGTLTKGFDFDAIDLIILRRATTSLPLFLQMLGRGSRVLDIERFLSITERTKKFFRVLDYGGNYIRFGLWDMHREWRDLWNKPKKSKEGVAPIKICPQCEFIAHVSTPVCPNCGYEYTKKDVPLEVGELIEITEIYSKLVEQKRQIGNLTPQELAIYSRLKNKKNFAARVARAREVDKPGYLEEYGKAMNYKPGWAEWQKKSIDSGGENGSTNFANFVLV